VFFIDRRLLMGAFIEKIQLLKISVSKIKEIGWLKVLDFV
jgi:hypothetical protein